MAGCAHCSQGPVAPLDREEGLVVALVGNPNTGKSSIFNQLTGSRQHVANWPGKTVERLHGTFISDGESVEIVDLPGTYSLNATSIEETIARDYLVGGECDMAVVVLDAANLERNLYFAIQVLETGLPTIVVLNMTDVAMTRGIVLDEAELSSLLGVPVVPMVARSGRGIEDLKSALVRATAEGVRQ